MTDPHPPPLRALQEDGDADIFALTSVKEDTLSRRGTFVGRTNRLANSVQTHFFRYRQCGSCRQARALDAAPLRLARQRGEDGGELQQQRLRAGNARGGQEKALHRRLCGAAHWEGDLRAGEKMRERAGVAGEARVRRISRPGDRTGERQRECAVSTLGVEEKRGRDCG